MGIIRTANNMKLMWRYSGELSKWLALAGAVCAVDHGVKYGIDTEAADGFPREMPRTKGLVEIHRVHNAGFAMGRFQRYPELIRTVPLALTTLLAGILASLCGEKPGQRMWKKLGLSLVIGGAGSNIIDRFLRGYVVDYLCLRAGALKKVVVNIGDIAILVGGVIYMLVSLTEDRGK